MVSWLKHPDTPQKLLRNKFTPQQTGPKGSTRNVDKLHAKPKVQVKNLNFSSFFSVHTCSWVNAITVQTTTLGTLQHI